MRNVIENIDSQEQWVRDFYAYAKSIPDLSRDEEKRLFRNYKAGDESAKTSIVEGNYSKVFGIVNHFSNCGVPLEDIIQEANSLLLTYIDEYDINSDRSFMRDYYHKIWNGLSEYVVLNTCGRSTQTRFIRFNHGSKHSLESDVYKSAFTPVPFEDQVEDKVYIEQLISHFRDTGMPERTIELLKMKLAYGYDKEHTIVEASNKIGVSRTRGQQLSKRIERRIDEISHVDNFDFFVPVPASPFEEVEVEQYMNMDEILRTREELKNPKYPLLLNFSKEELEVIKSALPRMKSKVVEKIYSDDLLAPQLRSINRGNNTFFFRDIYPEMIKIVIENKSTEQGFHLCRYEENAFLLQPEVILRGLGKDGPCKGFRIDELSFLLHKDIKDLRARISKYQEKIEVKTEAAKAKQLTK